MWSREHLCKGTPGRRALTLRAGPLADRAVSQAGSHNRTTFIPPCVTTTVHAWAAPQGDSLS